MGLFLNFVTGPPRPPARCVTPPVRRQTGVVNRHLGIGPTTARAISLGTSPQPARSSPSNTSEPSLTRPKLTARLSASSKRACASGPMPVPITPRTNAQPSCPDGFTATTGTDLMPVSAQSPPSAVLRRITEASQPQLPRSGPTGQPIESSQLAFSRHEIERLRRGAQTVMLQ